MKRITLFAIIFTLLNLIFIPLLSLYGLRVCPVLSIPGFGFGCYYSALFVVTANVLNLFLIYFMRKKDKRHESILYAGTYLFATLIALIVLQFLLHANHLTTHSRAPEILFFASLLLGITQSYGLNWARVSHPPDATQELKPVRFQSLWLRHTLRTLLPVIVVSAVMLHFLFSQSVSFNEGKTAPIIEHDALIESTAWVILILISWLFITLSFHFLSERDHASAVNEHLERLGKFDFKFRSDPSLGFGLWTAILSQLNSFSQALGEKTRLLNSFSRFVTASVAEKALHQDLETNGISQELTVIMTDIREFTALSEKMPPEQVVRLLNGYFSAMLEIISQFQIQVDKFIGDGILAYVESEKIPHPVSENRTAVAAALAMIERLVSFNAELKKDGLPELKIGIGIFRGPVVIGLIGTQTKLQHTIIGDTVNRTARLESLCKELEVAIVISGHVYHALTPELKNSFQSFGKRAVKGLSDPIEVFGGPVRI